MEDMYMLSSSGSSLTYAKISHISTEGEFFKCEKSKLLGMLQACPVLSEESNEM